MSSEVKTGAEQKHRQERLRGRMVTQAEILRVVERIVKQFHPEKIILFGSYAWGNPGPESDVDLVIIMETPLRPRQGRRQISKALSPHPFPLDLIVRTPQDLERRIKMGDGFLHDIIANGQVLYERARP